MKLPIKLRKPQEIIWLLSIVLLLLGLLIFFNFIALAGVNAFWFAFAAALLMVLGTWLF